MVNILLSPFSVTKDILLLHSPCRTNIARPFLACGGSNTVNYCLFDIFCVIAKYLLLHDVISHKYYTAVYLLSFVICYTPCCCWIFISVFSFIFRNTFFLLNIPLLCLLNQYLAFRSVTNTDFLRHVRPDMDLVF